MRFGIPVYYSDMRSLLSLGMNTQLAGDLQTTRWRLLLHEESILIGSMANKEVPEVLLSDGNGLLPANVLVERLKAVCLIQATVKDANQKPRLR